MRHKNFFIIIFLIQLNFFQTISSIHIGGTSMDSTHYDRRLYQQQQCPINHSLKTQRQVISWSNIKSSLLSTNNSNNGNNLIPYRRQFSIYNGDDQLITRASSDTIHINNTNPLDIDQASIDIIVDKQVRTLLFFF